MRRPCIEPGCPNLTEGTRCAAHARARDRARGSSAQRGYDSAWRALRAKAIRIWVRERGWVCPGWGIPPHPARDLTGDHLRWPARTLADVQVLCVGCNNRKGAIR